MQESNNSKSSICYFCKKPLDDHSKLDVKTCFDTFLNGNKK